MNKSQPLHVLAVTSGLSDERIAELWSESERFARSQIADQESHEYWHLLHQHMNERVEHEALGHMPHIEAPWVMFDTHVGMAYVALVDSVKECASHVRHYLHPETVDQRPRAARQAARVPGFSSRSD